MSDQRYKVVFSGQLLDGFDPGQVRRDFAARFRAPETLVERVFSGVAVVIKGDLPKTTATRLADLLDQLGMRSQVKLMPDSAETDIRSADPDGEHANVEVPASVTSEHPTDRLDDPGRGRSGNGVSKVDWLILLLAVLAMLGFWRWYPRAAPVAFSQTQLEQTYRNACGARQDCNTMLERQWQPCLAQADYERYQAAPAAALEIEEVAFFKRLHQCLVDADGQAMFE